ncbi:MAG: hypothetical protein E5X48_31025 [Mesorhizobium sp.]|uniref:hypothetical protein n=1 Tax=Mesorhizobium sp. TaxID=1871066 RepID=UPI00121DFEE3|nr:hypothetical protein [Mesorhizobium sp.]TIQ28743.1 MAG: hypothetical protein E5X48_31025 [Mesorhizobium sp.]
MADLAPNQLVLAVEKTTVEALLYDLIKPMSGRSRIVNSSGSVASFTVDVDYNVHDLAVRLHSPLIVFDKFEIDTTFYVRVTINFNGLYDKLPLPPRCFRACIPFTDICYEKCINFGSLTVSIPIPISFNVSGTYRPGVNVSDGEFSVFPEVVSVTPFVIDPVRLIERICAAIASVLPWPLNRVAEKICDAFASIFDFFVNALVKALNDFVIDFFDATGGWIGLRLRGLKLLKLPRKVFPGTTIPVQLNDLTAAINSADELDVEVIVLPAT